MNNLELAELYKPIVYFHSKEPYFPSTTADYIRNCKLYKNNDIILDTIDNPNQIVSADISPELSNINGTDWSWSVKLHDNKENRKGAEWFVKGNNVNIELYPEVPSFEYYFVNGNYELLGDFFDIVYTLTYPYNGTLSPHDYDEELCIIRFINNQPVRVGLSAHGGYEWYNYGNMEKENNRIVIYAAKESHAFYNEPKNYYRIFGFGSDLTDKGYKVDNLNLLYTPWRLDELNDDIKFLAFIGQRTKGANMHFAPKNRPSIYGPRHSSMELISNAIKGDIMNYLKIALFISVCLFIVSTYYDYKDGSIYIEFGQTISTIILFTLSAVLFTIILNSY